MKQVEFEEKVREMRVKHNKEKGVLLELLKQKKNGLSALREQLQDVYNKMAVLSNEKQFLGNSIYDLDTKFREQVNKMRQECEPLTRNLEDLSDWSLINELVARGFCGELKHAEKTEEYMEASNNKLKYNESRETPDNGGE